MEKDMQKDLQRIDIAFENLSYIVSVPKQKGELLINYLITRQFYSFMSCTINVIIDF